MGEWGSFESLVEQIQHKKNLLKNNTVALEAVFYYVAESDFVIHRFDEYLKEELEEAVASGFVTFDDDTNEVRLIEDDPAVKEFLEYFNLLGDFIREADQEFKNIFIETYKVKADISNKRFWSALGFL